jgi:hypothetical protein
MEERQLDGVESIKMESNESVLVLTLSFHGNFLKGSYWTFQNCRSFTWLDDNVLSVLLGRLLGETDQIVYKFFL